MSDEIKPRTLADVEAAHDTIEQLEAAHTNANLDVEPQPDDKGD
jgi:hypothetical protein